MEEKKIKELLAGVLAGLTDEQKEKAASCKDTKELIALLGEMNVSLPDELLEEAAGGYIWTNISIGGSDITTIPTDSNGGTGNPNPFAPPQGGKFF